MLITSVIKHNDASVIETTRAFLESLLPQAVAAGASSTAAPLKGQSGGGGDAAAASSTSANSGAKNKKKRQAQNKRKAAAMKERALLLARLELAKQTSEAQLQDGTQDSQTMAQLIADYFEQFSAKRCAYEDLRPYAAILDSKQKRELRDLLQGAASPSTALDDEPALVRQINAHKLRRFLQDYSSASPESEIALAQEYFGAYLRGLPIGKDLPKTEMQPADDLAFLSASALVSARKLACDRNIDLTEENLQLFDAASILEYALRFSPKGYILRLLLVRICSTLGAFNIALDHFKQLGVRSVQQDSMSHWIFERSSAFASADPDVKDALQDFSQVYADNEKETPRFISQAFQLGNYSRVEEMVEFYECLRFSLNRQLLNKERMLAFLSSGDVDGARAQAQEILDALESIGSDRHQNTLHDQRDFDIFPSYMPHGAPEVAEIVGTGPRPSTAHVRAFASFVLGKQGPEADSTVSETGGPRLAQFLTCFWTNR